MVTYDPNAPEAEDDGIRAEAIRRLKVRRLSRDVPVQNPTLPPSQRRSPDSAEGSAIQTQSNYPLTSSKTQFSSHSIDMKFSRKQTDVLAECISDLNSQIEEWLGFDIPAEGTEDYESWQTKISLIKEVKSISDVYGLCEGGDFKLPAALKDEGGE